LVIKGPGVEKAGSKGSVQSRNNALVLQLKIPTGGWQMNRTCDVALSFITQYKRYALPFLGAARSMRRDRLQAGHLAFARTNHV
jgi:hypothetical protein